MAKRLTAKRSRWQMPTADTWIEFALIVFTMAIMAAVSICLKGLK